MVKKKQSADSYIDLIGEYYAKLPNLSRNWQETIVQITPWLALIFGILGILGSVAALGIFPIAVVAGAHTTGLGFILRLLTLVSSVLLLAGFLPTRKRLEKGWQFIFYSEVVGLIGAIIVLSLSQVIFSLIGFYFLYQIRGYFKKQA